MWQWANGAGEAGSGLVLPAEPEGSTGSGGTTFTGWDAGESHALPQVSHRLNQLGTIHFGRQSLFLEFFDQGFRSGGIIKGTELDLHTIGEVAGVGICHHLPCFF